MEKDNVRFETASVSFETFLETEDIKFLCTIKPLIDLDKKTYRIKDIHYDVEDEMYVFYLQKK